MTASCAGPHHVLYVKCANNSKHPIELVARKYKGTPKNFQDKVKNPFYARFTCPGGPDNTVNGSIMTLT